MRLLDLFCCGGGCSVGYARAGFEVVGVDINPQPRYPFEFHQADALTFPLDGFDVIAASPPCKPFTVARKPNQVNYPHLDKQHPDLLTPIRERLIASGKPYVIENVPGAPMRNPIILCGSMFGLRVRRHRLFESNVALLAPSCQHKAQGPVVGVYGMGGAWTRRAPGGGGVKVVGADAADALGIDWTTAQADLSQAIPPAYTEFIGQQLLDTLTRVR